jgi:hypothetical protein
VKPADLIDIDWKNSTASRKGNDIEITGKFFIFNISKEAQSIAVRDNRAKSSHQVCAEGNVLV